MRSDLNAAYLWKLVGETGEAEAASHLRAAVSIACDVTDRARDLGAREVALSSSFEGSSFAMTFH